MNTPTQQKQPSERARARSVVGKLAHAFKQEHWSKGDIAQLRRLDVKRRQSSDVTFWRLATAVLGPARLLDERDGDEKALKWMALIQGLALIYKDHGPEVRLGSALHRANVSEQRLMRLLRAEGDALLTQVRRLGQQLRSQGQRVNWGDVADLVLSDGKSHQEKVRRHIASDYYKEQYKSNASDTGSTEN